MVLQHMSAMSNDQTWGIGIPSCSGVHHLFDWGSFIFNILNSQLMVVDEGYTTELSNDRSYTSYPTASL